jgi:hypothetical protein
MNINNMNLRRNKMKYNILVLLCAMSLSINMYYIIFGEYFHLNHKIQKCVLVNYIYNSNSNKICNLLKTHNLIYPYQITDVDYGYILCNKKNYSVYSYINYLDYINHKKYFCHDNNIFYKINDVYKIAIYNGNNEKMNYFYDDELSISNRLYNRNIIIFFSIISITLLSLLLFKYRRNNTKKYDLPLYHINYKNIFD